MTRAAAAAVVATLAAGCGGPGHACPAIVARSGVQVDVSAYVAAHPRARRWCVNDACVAVRRGPAARPAVRPAVRIVPPGTGPVRVRVTVTGPGGAPLLTATRTITLHRAPDVARGCPGTAMVGRLTVRAGGGIEVS